MYKHGCFAPFCNSRLDCAFPLIGISYVTQICRVPKRARVFVALNSLFVRCVVVQPKGHISERGFSEAIAGAGSAHRLSIEIRLWSCATSRIGCKIPHVSCDVACAYFAEPDHVPMMSNICVY